MVNVFREVDRAVAYVSSGFHKDRADGQVQVSFLADGASVGRTETVDPSSLTAALTQYCRRFPEAVAIFEVEDGAHPHAAIQCRCQNDNPKTCVKCCVHHHSRPMVIAMACERDHPPAPEAVQRTLQKFHEHLRGFFKEEGKKMDTRHFRHQSSDTSFHFLGRGGR